MNETITSILNRRSVRFYSSEPVSKETINTLLQCGNAAPSGANNQKWRFVVVQSTEFREKLKNSAIPKYNNWIKNAPEQMKAMRAELDKKVMDPVFYDAPLIIYVIGSGQTSDVDCAMVCENMMVCARSLGIGSCWVFFGQLALNDPEIKKEMELNEGDKVYGPIIFGYPSNGFPDAPPKKGVSVKYL